MDLSEILGSNSEEGEEADLVLGEAGPQSSLNKGLS